MENIRITNHTPKSCKKVKCHQRTKTWNSAVECANELNVCVTTIYNACNGSTKGVRIKGTGEFLQLCYEEDYATCQSMADAALVAKDEENKRLRAALEAATADALKWRAHEAELEAARIAEEKRLKAEREAEEARQKRIEELRAKVSRLEARQEKAWETVKESTKKYNELKERTEVLRMMLADLEGSEE